MSLLSFIVDTDNQPSSKRMQEIARENAEMERQSTEDVQEFLAAERAGKNYSMLDASGHVGKGIVGLMMVVSLGSIFGSFAGRMMTDKPAEPAVAQTQQVEAQQKAPTVNMPTKVFTLSR